MNNKKNIDRLFQEKLKDFEATPSHAVWENINQTMHGKRKKRRVVPIWFQLGGAAAILLLLLTIGGVFKPNNITDPNPNTVVERTTEPSKDSKSNSNTTLDASTELTSTNNEPKNSNGSNTGSFEEQNKSSSNNIYNDSRVVQSEATNPKQKTGAKKDRYTSNGSSNVKVATNANNKRLTPSNSTNTITSSQNKNENVLKDNRESKQLIKELTKNKDAVASNSPSEEKDGEEAPENPGLENLKDQIQDNALENAIAQAEDDLTDEKEKELKNRWSVSPNVAPVYFNTLGEGSSIHSQFNSNSKAGELNVSYGIAGAYKINERLKVRSGVNRVNLGYSTKGVLAYSNPTIDSNLSSIVAVSNSSNIDNINFNPNAANSSYISTSAITAANRTPEIIRTSAKSTLEQQFGFIEVPVELEYKLIDKKLDVNVIGGFSTMFLSENTIYDVSQGNRTAIGEANNLNDVSYSANFGIGVNYGISEKLNINLEPMFKYQINTFNNTSGDFQPYFIGVYTGLSFKF